MVATGTGRWKSEPTETNHNFALGEDMSITNTTIPKTTPEILERIKDLTQQARQSDAETARLNIQLGALFIQLKAKAPGTWLAKLKRMGYSPRVASRLMRAAKTLAAPDGTVSAKLLERLPGDPLKLETICALPLPDVERLITEHDCSLLDRQEVVALVRERQGKKPAADKKPLTPAEAIRQNWAQSVERLLQKLGKIEAKEEREALIKEVEESLADLMDSLHEAEDDGTDSENMEDGESADQEDEEAEPDPGEDATGSEGADELEAEEEEAEPVKAQEGKQEPGKGEKTVVGRPAGRQRQKPQPA